MNTEISAHDLHVYLALLAADKLEPENCISILTQVLEDVQNSAFGHGRHDQSAHVPLSFIGAQHRWSPCVSRVLSFRLAQSQ